MHNMVDNMSKDDSNKDKKPSETSLSDLIDNASSSVQPRIQQRTEKKSRSLDPKSRTRR